MLKQWIAGLAICTTVVAAGGSLALSQGFQAERNGDALVSPAQSDATVRTLQGAPPALPGEARPSPPAFERTQQPTAAAPRNIQPQPKFSGPSETSAPLRRDVRTDCPFSSGERYVCDFDRRANAVDSMHAFAGEADASLYYSHFLPQPRSVDSRCDGGICPFEN